MKGIKKIFAFFAHQRDIRHLKKIEDELNYAFEWQIAHADMVWFPDLEDVMSFHDYRNGREGLLRVIRRSMKYGFENPFKGGEFEDVCVFRPGLL